MTLLEILVQELETWPEGRECAYQSTTTSEAYFISQHEGAPKAITLCQIAPNRGIEHKVTREQWQVAKIKTLPFYKDVAAILGEERAVKELQAVGPISDTAQELDAAFVFGETPQGHEFWKDIMDPSRGADKLKQALYTITAAMKKAHPDSYLQLHSDGSGYVLDQDNDEITPFDDTDSLVSEYLAPTHKFEHWNALQDRFKWIAKDLDGAWWAYENRPFLESSDVGDVWVVTRGDCHTLEAMKVDIPCHWTNSLIGRPSHH